jgi:two-component system alkaline phosphatase synthesis response regulator PhoP
MNDGKHVILYLDDDQDMLDAVRMILEANGYDMVEAHSAEEGLRKYKEHTPDFLLVDLMMEEVDAGLNFAKEMKLLGNQLPLFLLSSVGDSLDDNTDYKALGLDGVFQKPVHPKTLLSILKKKLG